MRFGNSSSATLVLLFTLLTVSMPLTAGQQDKIAERSIAECDRLAASPDDPERKADGVDLAEINTAAAVEACSQAVILDDNPRLKYQYARSLGGYKANKEQRHAVSLTTGPLSFLKFERWC